jgi:ethanolamine utilization microcompartment shell protein EutS
MAKIEFSFQPFTKRVPLTISRGTSTHTMMGWLRWTENGVAGWGEAVPFAIDEQPQTVEGYEAALAANRGWLERATAWERIEIDRRLRAEGAPSGLIAAVNLALWDWLGKRLGQPVWRLLGLPATPGPWTAGERTVVMTTADVASMEGELSALRAELARYKTLELTASASTASMPSRTRSRALSDGSDLGASLRNPGNFCNVVGLRPSPGRVPTWPTKHLWGTLSVEGPMARTVEDTALLLSVQAGPDDRVPISLMEPGASFAGSLKRDFKDVRIGFSPRFGGQIPVDKRVEKVIAAQDKVFESLGCVLEDAVPDFSGAHEVFLTLRGHLFELNNGAYLDNHRDQLKETVIWNIEAGRKLTVEGPALRSG